MRFRFVIVAVLVALAAGCEYYEDKVELKGNVKAVVWVGTATFAVGNKSDTPVVLRGSCASWTWGAEKHTSCQIARIDGEIAK